jgi:hypothetical protein
MWYSNRCGRPLYGKVADLRRTNMTRSSNSKSAARFDLAAIDLIGITHDYALLGSELNPNNGVELTRMLAVAKCRRMAIVRSENLSPTVLLRSGFLFGEY